MQVRDYYREDKLPHIWCPGCGHGIIMNSLIKAIKNIGYEKDEVVVVSGIGCSSRAPGYMDFNTLHTTHGRALAFATGIKVANPDLKVIVISGDGDASAIGGNHLIHSARRNIDITTVVFNNNIYGMTGGQYSPTTPHLDYGTTAPYGNIDKPFDLAKLSEGAGATYVARSTAAHPDHLVKMIENGIKNKGFSMVEAISTCPTYYGRKNKKGEAPAMLRNLKENSIDVRKLEMANSEVEDKIVIGEFVNKNNPEYVEEYMKLVDRAWKNAGGKK